MNILSIDVGMKHLAYCVIKTNSKEEYEILDWSIINLCTDKVNPKCMTNTSKKIQFIHPIKKEIINIEAAPPNDRLWTNCLK